MSLNIGAVVIGRMELMQAVTIQCLNMHLEFGLAAEFGYHILSTWPATQCGSGWDNATPTLSTHGIFRNSINPLSERQYTLGC